MDRLAMIWESNPYGKPVPFYHYDGFTIGVRYHAPINHKLPCGIHPTPVAFMLSMIASTLVFYTLLSTCQ